MEGKLKKSKGPNTHSVWWCYIVAILLILIYLLPIYIMLNLSFRTLQDLGTKLSLPAAWNFGNYVEVFKSGKIPYDQHALRTGSSVCGGRHPRHHVYVC